MGSSAEIDRLTNIITALLDIMRTRRKRVIMVTNKLIDTEHPLAEELAEAVTECFMDEAAVYAYFGKLFGELSQPPAKLGVEQIEQGVGGVGQDQTKQPPAELDGHAGQG